MIRIRHSEDRGHFDYGWLKTYHSFSFDRYLDRRWMRFRTLRVINEDYIRPGTEFPMHPHRDMEIVTYLISGELTHKDSMGNGSTVYPGDVQRMTAGSGVTHSESNNSDEHTTHLLQIWILPNRQGLAPDYEQRRFTDADKQNRLRLVASREGENDSLLINQDVRLFASRLESGKSVEFKAGDETGQWIQVISGSLNVNGSEVGAGSAAIAENETLLSARAKSDSEFLLFDLA